MSPPLSDHTLVISLAKTTERGLSLETEIDPAALELPEDESLSMTAPVQVQGLLTRVMEQVYFHGSIRGVVTALCSRCLELAHDPFDVEARGVFLPVGSERASGDAEEDAVSDEIDVYTHDGLRLDLYPLIRDQVVMALPVQVLCREDCAGLCQACGVNRNEQPCSCEAESTDPRFAILKHLRSSESA